MFPIPRSGNRSTNCPGTPGPSRYRTWPPVVRAPAANLAAEVERRLDRARAGPHDCRSPNRQRRLSQTAASRSRRLLHPERTLMRAALALCPGSLSAAARHGGQPDDHRAETSDRQPAAAVASTACRMSWVAASGWDTNETCEAGTSTIVALRALGHEPLQLRRDRLVLGTEQIPARQCLPRWRGRRRGCERSDGVGPLCHGHHCGRLRIDVGGEGFTERLVGEVEVGALAPVGIGERNRPDRRPDKAAFELSRGAAAGSRPRRTSSR